MHGKVRERCRRRRIINIVQRCNVVRSYLVMVKMLFSPKLISMTPSSQPAVRPLTTLQRLCSGQVEGGLFNVPLMTFPTPIGVLKSPRPMEESNLTIDMVLASSSLIMQRCLAEVYASGWRGFWSSLGTPVLMVRLFWIVKRSGVFDGYFVTFLWLVDAVALFEDLASDPHGDCCRSGRSWVR